MVEVDSATWASGGSTALAGGFNFGFGATATFVLSTPGTYYYVCQPHVSSGMTGTITVLETGSVSHYLARVREVGSSSWNIKGNIGNGLSKTIGSLSQGATYEFETRTWCNTGDANNPTDPYYKSDWSGNGQFTTVPCPVQTDNLAVTQLTSSSADFSWTLISASPAADHFTIRFREVALSLIHI